MKTWHWLALVLVAVALGFLAGHSTGLDPAYYVARAKYEADLKAANNAKAPMEAENTRLREDNAKKDAQLVEQAGQIKTLMGTAAQAGQAAATAAEETARLKSNVQAVIDANPGVKALVDNYEFRLAEQGKEITSLRATVAELGIPVDTGKVDAEGRKIILYPAGSVTDALNKERLNEKAIGKNWETRCLRAEGLLVTCDGLRVKAEKQAGFSGLLAKIEAGVILAPVTYLGGKALGHALKLW